MQTIRRQTQSTSQKITPPYFYPSANRPYGSERKFRFWLGVTVFYPFLLFLTLFVGVAIRHTPATTTGIISAGAVLLITCSFLMVSYVLVSSILTERKIQKRELSRAQCLVQVAEIVNGTTFGVRDKMKRVGNILASEGDKEGWRCRIVLQNDPTLFPPSGHTSLSIPLSVQDKTVGMLLISAGDVQFDSIDQNFFSSLSRILSHSIFREKLWADFHSEIEQIQGALLLNSDLTPNLDQINAVKDTRTVEQMLRMLGLVQGKVENSVDNKL